MLLLARMLVWLPAFGIRIGDHLPGLLADELDQRRDAQCLPDVLHVDDQCDDAGEDEQERGVERDPRHPPGPVALVRDGTERQQRVDEIATNSPMASWLGLSRRIRWTIRGENCPIAS